MARWSLQRRTQSHRSLNLTSPHPLDPIEVRYRRLELSADMVELVLYDEPRLPDALHHTLQRIYDALSELREQARDLS